MTSALTRTSHDGLTLPAIGFGTYQLRGQAGARTVGTALANGYTLLDSAVGYENEGAVGRAVRETNVPRDQVVVTSKLPGRHHAHDDALATIEESVYRTGLERVDLYLIHWPNPRIGKYVEAWEALVEARERGLVGAIGVSNFLPEHLEAVERATGVRPSVNQIELHPYFPQTELLAHHRALGILTEAWSPLGRASEMLHDPVIGEIAEAHAASPVRTVLAWHVAVGAIPLPKASSPGRQRDNLAAPDLVLDEDEVARITALGRPDGRTANQDPAVYEEL